MEVLNDARVANGLPGQPAPVQQMRTALLAADHDAKAPGAQGRADLTSRIVAVEQWAAARESTVLNMTARTYTEPYDQQRVDKLAADWAKQVPMTRENLLSPQQQIDARVNRVWTLWTLDDSAARPCGTLLHNKRAQATLQTLEANAVPKATWDRLVTGLVDFELATKAVETLKTAPALLALCVRLDRRALTGANLTTLIAAGELEIPRGRSLPYRGGGPVEIEAGGRLKAVRRRTGLVSRDERGVRSGWWNLAGSRSARSAGATSSWRSTGPRASRTG
jgi:hypothetical protein